MEEEVTVAVLHSTALDETWLEMLKALDKVRIVWLACLFSVTWRSGAVLWEEQTGMEVPIFKNGTRGCVLITASASQDKPLPRF